MRSKDFDFKIREELKKLPEFKNLRSHFSEARITSEAGVLVTGEMIIDMITYSSQGDLDVAIRGLETSELFVDRCLEILFPLPFSFCFTVTKACTLLFELWRLDFVETRCLLEVKWNDADEQGDNAHEGHTTSAHVLIEQIVASMNADDQMSVINRINESIEHSRVGCSMINHLWKIYPKITENMK